MKCNNKQNTTINLNYVYNTVHKEMNYDKMLTNTLAINEESTPQLSVDIRSLIVTYKIDLIVEEVELLFFLDVNSIPSLNRIGNGCLYVPITIPLLNKYGVTQEQFIEDFKNKGLVATELF